MPPDNGDLDVEINTPLSEKAPIVGGSLLKDYKLGKITDKKSFLGNHKCVGRPAKSAHFWIKTAFSALRGMLPRKFQNLTRG